MIKKIANEVLKVLLIILIGVAIGFMALCLAHALPVERMYQNVQGSKEAISTYRHLVNGYDSTAVDNYTDCIMVNEAICSIDAPLFERVINNYQVNYWKGYEQQENLLRYLDGEQGYKYQGYSHYWGGHQVVLKFLFLFLDYSDVMVFNYIVQTIMIILIIVGLYRSNKAFVILPLSVAMITMMPITIAMCLQFSTVFCVTLVGTLYIVWRNSKIKHSTICYLFLILGMMTSYFDFLTYPFVSLGVPLVTYLAYIYDEKTKKQLYHVVMNSMLWCIGYVGMWAGKWVVGSILSPDSGSLMAALEAIAYRGSNRAGEMTLSVFDVLMKNLFVYLRKPTIFLIGGVAVYLVILILIRAKNTSINLKCIIPYLVICIYPIIWYRIARNHSYEHAFMAYRELSIAIFAGLSMLSVLSENTKPSCYQELLNDSEQS